jgi:RNA polymerase sigma-70 factor (ECF subfamily)
LKDAIDMIEDVPSRDTDAIGPSDEDLIERFQQGDVYAYDLIVKRYKEPLLNFVYRFIGNIEEAEDIVQETFLRVYRKKHAYRRIAKFSTWIYTIAGNLSRTELRRRRRRKLFSVSDMGFDEKDYEISDEEFNPEDNTEGILQGELIQKEIENLSPKFREVILLRDVQELSYEEISQIIKVPIGTVKSRVNRARTRLQSRLEYLMKKK